MASASSSAAAASGTRGGRGAGSVGFSAWGCCLLALGAQGQVLAYHHAAEDEGEAGVGGGAGGLA